MGRGFARADASRRHRAYVPQVKPSYVAESRLPLNGAPWPPRSRPPGTRPAPSARLADGERRPANISEDHRAVAGHAVTSRRNPDSWPSANCGSARCDRGCPPASTRSLRGQVRRPLDRPYLSQNPGPLPAPCWATTLFASAGALLFHRVGAQKPQKARRRASWPPRAHRNCDAKRVLSALLKLTVRMGR
jgi:hypothetical protein